VCVRYVRGTVATEAVDRFARAATCRPYLPDPPLSRGSPARLVKHLVPRGVVDPDAVAARATAIGLIPNADLERPVFADVYGWLVDRHSGCRRRSSLSRRAWRPRRADAARRPSFGRDVTYPVAVNENVAS
jgi:hypothetical protein